MILLFIIATIIVALTILLFLQKKPGVINIPLGFIALLLIGGVVYLAAYGLDAGCFYLRTSGDPRLVTNGFYKNLLEGNYDEAYAYLNNYKSVGIEDIIGGNTLSENSLFAGEAAGTKIIVEALRESYDYTIPEASVIDGLKATQKVEFRYLNLKSFEEDTAAQIDDLVSERIKTRKRSELYDSDGNYLDSLMDEVYMEALMNSVSRASEYYEYLVYDVELEYVDGQWYINYNDNITKGFLGGN